VCADKLEMLMAELLAIESWNQAGEKVDPEDEFDRAGFRARRMRRDEIMRQIDALVRTRSSEPVTIGP
jgi:hypothetical protein